MRSSYLLFHVIGSFQFLINSGVSYLGRLRVIMDLLRLITNDQSYLFVDDSNINAIDDLQVIVIISMRKSKDILDDCLDILSMLTYVRSVFCHRCGYSSLSIFKVIEFIRSVNAWIGQ